MTHKRNSHSREIIMPFHVISLDTGKPLERDGAIVVLETGQDAARMAQQVSAETGARYQPRRVAEDVDWRAREQSRFDSGAYLPIPSVWSGTSWWFHATCQHNEWSDTQSCYVVKPARLPDHFAHPSSAKDGMVAFTEDETKGAQDRQTRLTPGRYLTRYFADVLSTEEIARFAALYSAEFEDIEVKISQDADEIERVYTNGPRSCMSHSARHYETDGIHPARVYAGPDLGVAFIEPSSGISARAVVWPERKIYSRIYGDETRLERLFDAMGYSSGSLDGARVRKIEDGGCYVMPYIDDCSSAEVDGKYIRLGSGDLDCQNTSGLSGERHSWHCDNCEEGFTDDDSQYTVHGRRGREYAWCEHCSEHSAFYCAGTQEYYDESSVDSVRVNGETYCQEYASDHFVRCEATDEYVDADDCVTLEDGTVWSADHFRNHGHTCDHCGCLYDAEDIQCDCAEEQEGTEGAQEDTEAQEDTRLGPGRMLVNGRLYVARQGADTHPDQLELTYSAIEVRGCTVAAGDTVYWNGSILIVTRLEFTTRAIIRAREIGRTYEWDLTPSEIETTAERAAQALAA
jgi:hypothetical protein